jgi:hypothetical protein
MIFVFAGEVYHRSLVQRPQKDSRCGRDHVFSVIVFQKTGGSTKANSGHQTRLATGGPGSRKQLLLVNAGFNQLQCCFFLCKRFSHFRPCTGNEYSRFSNCIAGLPSPGSILCYTFKAEKPCISKYGGSCLQDPIPFSLLEELHGRYLTNYDAGAFDSQFFIFSK